MGLARYDIVPVGKRWARWHDGAVSLEYSIGIRIAAAASMAIREGHEVQISVPRRSINRGQFRRSL
jgi:hypothetical protein